MEKEALKETLLEKAKKIPSNKRRVYNSWNEEDLDLVLAWLNGEITADQICEARNVLKTSGNYLYYSIQVIRKHVAEGKIKIIKT
jgi:hypothetical protein